jgi:hypothetical protein
MNSRLPKLDHLSHVFASPDSPSKEYHCLFEGVRKPLAVEETEDYVVL